MAYDECLAAQVRRVLRGRKGIAEKKMFGGLCFLSSGSMSCGIVNGDLVVRVGGEQYESSLAEPGVRPMDFTGKPLRGFVYVGAAGLRGRGALEKWIRRGLDQARIAKRARQSSRR